MRAAAVVGFLLVSGLYTSAWAVWQHELFRDLTWLAVPLAFTLAVPLAARQRLAVGSLFVLGTAGIGLVTVGQYLLNPARANEAFRIGQNMPAITHVFHISFGLMLALACFWALELRRNPLAGLVLRAALLGAAAVAALTLHILAYRTGLLVFYTGLLACAVRLLLRRHLSLGLGLLAMLGLGPWLAYHTSIRCGSGPILLFMMCSNSSTGRILTTTPSPAGWPPWKRRGTSSVSTGCWV